MDVFAFNDGVQVAVDGVKESAAPYVPAVLFEAFFELCFCQASSGFVRVVAHGHVHGEDVQGVFEKGGLAHELWREVRVIIRCAGLSCGVWETFLRFVCVGRVKDGETHEA